jgi:hypothetical protein
MQIVNGGIKSIKAPLKEEEQLFYLHIPKCAGTTLIGILDQRFTIDEICPEHYVIEAMEEISDEKLAKYKFIRGHFQYFNIIPRLKKKPRCMTFLRDPVARYLSFFEMRKRVPDPLVGLQDRLSKLTLDEYMTDPELQTRFANQFTRLFGGFKKLQSGKKIPNIDLAKERLATFDYIGLVEKFDESLELLAYIFDFPPIGDYQSLNISPRREDREAIGQSTLDRVTEMNWADVELYKFGLDLYQKQYEQVMNEKAILGEPELQENDRLDSLSFDFSRMSPGSGWHVGEPHSKYGVIRWSGPNTKSIIYLPLVDDQTLNLEFQVVEAMAWDILDSLKLAVNDVIIPLNRTKGTTDSEFQFTGLIPIRALENIKGKSQFAFQVSRTTSSKNLSIDESEQRGLGICYDWLRISPA